MAYTYDRRASGTASRFSSWADLLEAAQAEFVGLAGETLHKYVMMLHGRLRDDLTNWNYGTPRRLAGDAYEITVYCKSMMGDVSLNVQIEFNGSMVSVKCKTADATLVEFRSDRASASDVGMKCGAAWEKKHTGDVDYGD